MRIWDVQVKDQDVKTVRKFTIIDSADLPTDEFGLYLVRQFGKERVVEFKENGSNERNTLHSE